LTDGVAIAEETMLKAVQSKDAAAPAPAPDVSRSLMTHDAIEPSIHALLHHKLFLLL